MRRSSVLAVFSVLLAGAVAEAGETLPALSTEVRFGCAPRQAVKVDVIEDLRTLVEVPEGCPGAGQKFLVSLACPVGKPCHGSAFVRDYVVAYLAGARAKVRPTNLQAEAPEALKQLQVRVLGTTRVEVDDSLLKYRAAVVWVEHKEQRAALRLAPGAAGVVRFKGTGRKQVALAFQLDRSKKESVRLRVVVENGKLLLDEELALGAERELDCATTGMSCAGPLRLGVRDAEGPLSTASRELP
jgi:hypothetical protein